MQKGFFGIGLPKVRRYSFGLNSDGFAQQSGPGFHVQIRLSSSEGIVHEKTRVVPVRLGTDSRALKFPVTMPDENPRPRGGLKASESIEVQIFAGIPRAFIVVIHFIESRVGQRVHVNHPILVDNVVSGSKYRLKTDAARNPVQSGTFDAKHFGFLHQVAFSAFINGPKVSGSVFGGDSDQ